MRWCTSWRSTTWSRNWSSIRSCARPSQTGTTSLRSQSTSTSRFKDTLNALDSMTADEEGFDQRINEAHGRVRHHVQEEEGEIFPKIRAAVSEDGLPQMRERMQRAKKMVPTRPHPKAPTSPGGKMGRWTSGATRRWLGAVTPNVRTHWTEAGWSDPGAVGYPHWMGRSRTPPCAFGRAVRVTRCPQVVGRGARRHGRRHVAPSTVHIPSDIVAASLVVAPAWCP